MTFLGLEEARSSLPEIVERLSEDPARVFAVVRSREPVVVVLPPATFDGLVEAAHEALDLWDAADALTTEPLASFADYYFGRRAVEGS